MNTTFYLPLTDVEIRARQLIADYFIAEVGDNHNRICQVWKAVMEMPAFPNFLEMVCDEVNWSPSITLKRATDVLIKAGINEEAAGFISSEVFKMVVELIGTFFPAMIVGDTCISRVALVHDGLYDLMLLIPNSDQVFLG